ncbi:MAG: serine hydrolase domain-containing protein, partial [Bacteroidota bacterium]
MKQLRLPMGILLGLSLLMIALVTSFPTPSTEGHEGIPFLKVSRTWADASLRGFSERQKLEQMLLVVDPADSSQEILNLLAGGRRPGGVVFSGLEVEAIQQRATIYDQQADFPLLIAARNVPQPHFLNAPAFPAINAINQDSLLLEVGTFAGRKARAQHIDLLIGTEISPLDLPAAKALQGEQLGKWFQGIQENRVLASPFGVQPYFPQTFDSLILNQQLAPYRAMADRGTAVFWLNEQVIDRIHLSSRKKAIIKSYLQKHLDYEGLLVAELPREAEEVSERVRKMIKAGVDLMVIAPNQYEIVLAELELLRRQQQLPAATLEAQTRRILYAKTWVNSPHLQEGHLEEEESEAWETRRLRQASLTLVKNASRTLPIAHQEGQIAHLHTLGKEQPELLNQMQHYQAVSSTHQVWEPNEKSANFPLKELQRKRLVVLSMAGVELDPRRDADFIQSLYTLAQRTRLVIVNHDQVENIAPLADLPCLVQAYRTDSLTQHLMGQLLFGGIAPQGQLPLDVNPDLLAGHAESLIPTRLGYTLPEELGIATQELSEIDSIVQEGMEEFAMPGAQVLVAKSGKVIYHKSFGHHTYARQQAVAWTDVYDLASVTKVAATTVASMLMQEAGKMKPADRLGTFFRNEKVRMPARERVDTLWVNRDTLPVSGEESPFILAAQRSESLEMMKQDSLWWGTDSAQVIRRWRQPARVRYADLFDLDMGELLSHHSGLPAGLPILPYLNYRDSLIGTYDRFYGPRGEGNYQVEVARNFYLRRDYRDSLWEASKRMYPAAEKAYEYSDANMILVQQAIDSLNQEPLDSF